MALRALPLLTLLLAPSLSWRTFPRPTALQRQQASWCALVADPPWPLAYSKAPGPLAQGYWEAKGRTMSSHFDLGHACSTRGARSKCSLCLNISCGAAPGETCALQLQGTAWALLPANVPTVTDVPFAVGARVTHRYDYASAERVCLLTSGGACARGDGRGAGDYRACTAQCWGVGGGAPFALPPELLLWQAGGYNSSAAAAPPPAGGPPLPLPLPASPVGVLGLLAGGVARGYADGVGTRAQFNAPAGLAVDAMRAVYVADAGNHALRRVNTSIGAVSTLAGRAGVAGLADAPPGSAWGAGLLSSPRGVAVCAPCAPTGGPLPLPTGALPTCTGARTDAPIVYLADTGNHRIRVVVEEAGGWSLGTGGGGGARGGGDLETPPSGLADGVGTAALFQAPAGLACDPSGHVFVADTGNGLVRWIEAGTGVVRTLAGGRGLGSRADPPLGCVWGSSPSASPSTSSRCWVGLLGYADGAALAQARFHAPTAIALLPLPRAGGGSSSGGAGAYAILVADGHRVRYVYSSAGDLFAGLERAPAGSRSASLGSAAGAALVSMSSGAINATFLHVGTAVGGGVQAAQRMACSSLPLLLALLLLLLRAQALAQQRPCCPSPPAWTPPQP